MKLTDKQKTILIDICQQYKDQNGTIKPISGLEPELLMIILSTTLSEYGFKNISTIQEIEQATDLDLYFSAKYQ